MIHLQGTGSRRNLLPVSRRKFIVYATRGGLALPLALSIPGCVLSVPSETGTPAPASSPGNVITPSAVGQGATKPKLTVRLGWGKGGVTDVARTRGVFEEALRQKGISVEWIGPFPNHAPSLEAVTARSADFSFGGSSTPAMAAIIAGSPLV